MAEARQCCRHSSLSWNGRLHLPPSLFLVSSLQSVGGRRISSSPSMSDSPPPSLSRLRSITTYRFRKLASALSSDAACRRAQGRTRPQASGSTVRRTPPHASAARSLKALTATPATRAPRPPAGTVLLLTHCRPPYTADADGELGPPQTAAARALPPGDLEPSVTSQDEASTGRGHRDRGTKRTGGCDSDAAAVARPASSRT